MRVNSSFSFKGDASFLNNDIRCKINGDPLGALGDLSWLVRNYCRNLLPQDYR